MPAHVVRRRRRAVAIAATAPRGRERPATSCSKSRKAASRSNVSCSGMARLSVRGATEKGDQGGAAARQSRLDRALGAAFGGCDVRDAEAGEVVEHQRAALGLGPQL